LGLALLLQSWVGFWVSTSVYFFVSLGGVSTFSWGLLCFCKAGLVFCFNFSFFITFLIL